MPHLGLVTLDLFVIGTVKKLQIYNLKHPDNSFISPEF